MNDLNYIVDGVRYYYQLDTSKWYTLDKNNQVKYVNTGYDNQYDNMSYVYDTVTLCPIPNDNLSYNKQINTYREQIGNTFNYR